MLGKMQNVGLVALSIGDVGRRPDKAAAWHGVILDLQEAALGADPVEAPVSASMARRHRHRIPMTTSLLAVCIQAVCSSGVDTGQKRFRPITAKLPVAAIAGNQLMIPIEDGNTLIDVLEGDFKLR